MTSGSTAGASASRPSTTPAGIKIDLADTAVAGRELHPLKLERSEHDWYVIRREEGTFVAACGPLNLGEVLYLFRRWVQGDQDLNATGTASL